MVLVLLVNMQLTQQDTQDHSNAKVLLGGDFEINTRNEKVDDQYLKKIEKFGTISSTVEFSTMLANSTKSDAKTFFIRLKAIDQKYPLYGSVQSFPDNALTLLQTTKNSIVVNKKIFETLKLKVNDTVFIKQTAFKVIGYVESVPDLGRALLFGDFAVVSTNSFLNLNINTLEYIIITGVDITNLKNIEKSVLKKNEELKKINTELDNFVYSVSHDLRSPLLSIKGILELILKTNLLDEKITHYLNLAKTSTIRLDGTIQEILEYSKNARYELELEVFDVQEMVQLIFEDLKFTDNMAVNFEMDIQGSPIIYSDKKRTNTLLKNLIGNSVKYKRNNIDNSFVKFSINTTHDNIQMLVVDNGMGISELSIGKVFDMFYRGTKLSGGTGLGLYICKEIVNKLHGEISVKSQLNIGTTFEINIPKIKQ